MADGPQLDIGAQNFARGVGVSGPKAKTDDYVNQENAVGEHTKAGIDQAAEGIKLSVPFLGKLMLLLPGVGAQAGLESEGITGKMIMPSFMPDSQGGFLARLLHSIFIKNREVTDNTGGGGGDYTGGGSGGGGGDFGSDFISQSSFPQFENFASPSSSFDWSDISWASLGGLPRPSLPDMGPSADLGVA